MRFNSVAVFFFICTFRVINGLLTTVIKIFYFVISAGDSNTWDAKKVIFGFSCSFLFHFEISLLTCLVSGLALLWLFCPVHWFGPFVFCYLPPIVMHSALTSLFREFVVLSLSFYLPFSHVLTLHFLFSVSNFLFGIYALYISLLSPSSKMNLFLLLVVSVGLLSLKCDKLLQRH